MSNRKLKLSEMSSASNPIERPCARCAELERQLEQAESFKQNYAHATKIERAELERQLAEANEQKALYLEDSRISLSVVDEIAEDNAELRAKLVNIKALCIRKQIQNCL